MGLGIPRISSRRPPGCRTPAPPGDPDPLRWHHVRSTDVGRFTVLEVVYEGVKNFEGRKILVFVDASYADLVDRPLDPHFSEHSPSPVARFVPTDEGWRMAVDFCKMMVS